MAERLRLLAVDEQDLESISALMQDATVKPDDIGYDRRGRRLVILANRYCWEARTHTRVRAALRIESIISVRRRHWPAGNTVLDLLAIRGADGCIELDFAGGAALRADVECIDVALHDLGRPWRAQRTPRHDV